MSATEKKFVVRYLCPGAEYDVDGMVALNFAPGEGIDHDATITIDKILAVGMDTGTSNAYFGRVDIGRLAEGDVNTGGFPAVTVKKWDTSTADLPSQVKAYAGCAAAGHSVVHSAQWCGWPQSTTASVLGYNWSSRVGLRSSAFSKNMAGLTIGYRGVDAAVARPTAAAGEALGVFLSALRTYSSQLGGQKLFVSILDTTNSRRYFYYPSVPTVPQADSPAFIIVNGSGSGITIALESIVPLIDGDRNTLAVRPRLLKYAGRNPRHDRVSYLEAGVVMMDTADSPPAGLAAFRGPFLAQLIAPGYLDYTTFTTSLTNVGTLSARAGYPTNAQPTAVNAMDGGVAVIYDGKKRPALMLTDGEGLALCATPQGSSTQVRTTSMYATIEIYGTWRAAPGRVRMSGWSG